MTFSAFLLILASAGFHASWNLLSKSKRPSMAFYMQASMTAAIMWLGMTCWGITKVNWSSIPNAFYIMFIGSVVCEVLYFTSLANTYRRADISLAYPMARALPVLFTAILTLIFHIGKPLSSCSIIGLVLIFFGCFIMPLPSFRELKLKTYLNSHFIFIVLAACGTTGYTIFDSQAIKFMQNSFSADDKVIISCMYLGLLELAICSSMFLCIQFFKEERLEFKQRFCRTVYPSFSGIFSTLAYGMILLAMPMVTNVSLVQAFRQLSLPICAVAGVLLLHEKITIPRITGFILIFGGLVLSVF
ncbi:MAG: EamA family transporter [Lentisphaeria bacterium]|nr:EamA family transporter [Lentisphaeria bacterium]